MEQFLRGRELSIRSPARTWKTVAEGEIYVILGLFMLIGIVQKPALRSYFIIKKCNFHTGVWRHYNTRQIEINFCISLTIKPSVILKVQKKLLKILPVILHLNNKFHELYLPSQDISIDELLTLCKGRLSFKGYLPLRHPNLY